MARKLSLSYYQRDTVTIARELLGQTLVHVVRGKRLSGKIVETEAYVGAIDRACHGFGFRRTERTRSLFQPGGNAYVYFIYGMHFCFNVVTSTADAPEAVLVRAVEPIEGVEWMRRFRDLRKGTPDIQLTNGPAKLCEALAIGRAQDRLSLAGDELFIEQAKTKVPNSSIIATPRIGVDYAREAAEWPLRFFMADSPYVSKTPKGFVKIPLTELGKMRSEHYGEPPL